MNATEEKSGERRVCMACIDRQRRINALRATLAMERELRDHAKRSRPNHAVEGLAAIGAIAIVALILWALGRLAVVIGGAS